MHAKAIIYMVLVILHHFIMDLNAEDGTATFDEVNDKEFPCGDDIIIKEPRAIVSRNAWVNYGGCGAYFLVTCVEGVEACANKDASVTVQAIDYAEDGLSLHEGVSYDNHFTLTFEEFDKIAGTLSTLINIHYTHIERLDDVVAGVTTNAEDGTADSGVVKDMEFTCDEDIIINVLSAIVSRKAWMSYGGCGTSFKVTCVDTEGMESCATKGASVTVQAIDYYEEGVIAKEGASIDNHFRLTSEAFKSIAAPLSTLINIQYTRVKEFEGEDEELTDEADKELEDAMMAALTKV